MRWQTQSKSVNSSSCEALTLTHFFSPFLGRLDWRECFRCGFECERSGLWGTVWVTRSELRIAMDGPNEKEFASPESLARLKVGDLVHVFEGTGAGLVNGRDVGWFGKVVGMEGETYLVRNRLLNGRGPANRVLGQFLKLQKDFGFAMGGEERVHFRSLSKRTRERLLSSSDELT